MATTFMDKQKNGLIKKFHTLLGKANYDQLAKEGILASYRVEHANELTVTQLIEACAMLDGVVNPQAAELDRGRKRLMGAIGGYLNAMGMGMENNINIIKGIACRAAKRDRFNDIPQEQLRSLYYAFGKKQKDLAAVEEMTVDLLDILTRQN
jgi:hypothetical protein